MKNHFAIIDKATISEFFLEFIQPNVALWKDEGHQVQFEILKNGPQEWILKDEKNTIHKLICIQSHGVTWVQYKNKIVNFEICREKELRRKRIAGEASGASGQVMAPMPGRITKVEVREGDMVELGQGLLVMEAMKMENELKAPKSGSVRKIFVQEGDTVEAKHILVEIEET